MVTVMYPAQLTGRVPARRTAVVGTALLLLLAPLALVATTRPASAATPSCPPVAKTRSGEQHRAVDATDDGHSWKLSGAVWNHVAPDPIDYPVRSDAWTRGCIFGGKVIGNVPRRWTRDQWYDAEDGGRRLGGDAFRPTMTDTSDNYLRIKGAYVSDFEDAFNPDAARRDATTYLEHVHTRYIRDDCVENEEVPHNLVITDSLLDGCFTAFAERPSGEHHARNGQGSQRFVVRDSLVYVQPQRLGPNYCDADGVRLGRCRRIAKNTWLGAYGIWKWSPDAARSVTVTHTIFRLDVPSYSSCAAQQWPAGTYRHVTLVWTGKGRYRTAGGCHNVVPRGVKVTRDVRVWKRAKRAWLR